MSVTAQTEDNMSVTVQTEDNMSVDINMLHIN